MEIHEPTPADLDALLALLRARPRVRAHVLQGAGARPRHRRGLADRRPRPPRARASTTTARVVGYVAVVRLSGWSDHVGDLRLVVDPEAARPGRSAGRSRAGRCCRRSTPGSTKLTVEVVAEQEGAVAMFSGLGFQAEGLLRDHVRDRDGSCATSIVLSHSVEDAWSAMETAGIDDALA